MLTYTPYDLLNYKSNDPNHNPILNPLTLRNNVRDYPVEQGTSTQRKKTIKSKDRISVKMLTRVSQVKQNNN